MKGKREGLNNMCGVASGTSVKGERDDVSSVETDLGSLSHSTVADLDMTGQGGTNIFTPRVTQFQQLLLWGRCEREGALNTKKRARERGKSL